MSTLAKRTRRWLSSVTLLIALLLPSLSPESAWALGPKSGIPPTADDKNNSADAILGQVTIEQKLGETVPLDLAFTQSSGEKVALKDLVGERPVVLSLVYYECPMLCTMVLNGLLRALNVVKFDVGKEFDVLTVSIDPRETAALAQEKKGVYLDRYRRSGAKDGWHFMVGDQASISELSQAVGFNYVYDEETDQYAHASGIVVLTPEGKISKYLLGIDYSPRDLRFSLVEASKDRIGSWTDAILLSCFQYNPSEGRYSLAVLNIVRLVGILTVLAILSFIIISRIHERRREASNGIRSGEPSQPVTESGSL